MFGFFKRLRRSKQSTAQTKLSHDAVLAIARRAAANESLAEDLALMRLEQRAGRTIWIVSSATVGSRLHVTIDDSSGEVLEKQLLGGR
jgi:hypothetical protein